MLEAWGVAPDAASGHSAGEYVAACLAGVFTLEDGLSMVALRGRLFETLERGGMLSISRGEEDVRSWLPDGLDIAAVNAPDQTVVSGPVDLVTELERTLTAEEIDCTRVHIDVAAHSSMLDPILAEFHAFCRTIDFRAPKLSYISNLTGDWATAALVTDPQYWVDHLRSPVRFAAGVERLLEDPNRTFVEIGPGRTLIGLANLGPRRAVGATPMLRHPKEAVADQTFALRALGRIWVSGVELEAARLYGPGRRRVDLPTYPFERARYWVDPDPVERVVTRHHELARREHVEDWFSIPSWRPSVPPPPEESEVARHWVVVHDGAEVAGTLERLLAARGDHVVSVELGRRFRRLGVGRYMVDPAEQTHWTRLVDALRTRQLLPDHVVHLTAVGAPPWRRDLRHPEMSAYEAVMRRDYASLVHLAQALSSLSKSVRLTVVTSGVHAVDGDEHLHPERALLHGVARVLPREASHITTTAVDIDLDRRLQRPSSRAARVGVVADALLRELVGRPGDPVVVHRHGRRLVRDFLELPLAPVHGSWSADDVVLITGGLGGIGLAVAEHIARSATGVTLVLLGRTPLPSAQEWEVLRSRSGSDPTVRQRIEAVARLRGLGAVVRTVAADVTDRAAMQVVLDDVIRDHGRPTTVIHAAGVLHDALLALRDPVIESAVIDAKARGAIVLRELLSPKLPPRWVLFSSVASIIGLPGQADYSAANAFLDAFASKLAADGVDQVVSVNWNAWQQVGMAVAAVEGQSPPPPRSRAAAVGAEAPLFDSIEDEGSIVTCTASLDRERDWLVGEHVVRGGTALVPGTGHLELLRAAANVGLAADQPTVVRDVLFLAPFAVEEGEERELNARLERATGQIAIFGLNEQEPNVTATVARGPSQPPVAVDLAAVRARCSERQERFDGYADQPFMDFGPRWGVLRQIDFGRDEALVTTSVPTAFVDELARMWLHPPTLDMATGSAQALIPGFSPTATFFVPLSYGSVTSYRPIPAEAVSHVRLRSGGTADIAIFDVTICDPDGQVAVDVDGYTMRKVVGSGFGSASRSAEPDRATAFGLRTPITDALRVGILPAEGVDALDRMLMAERAGVGHQIVASSVDLGEWTAKVDAEATMSDDIGAVDPAAGVGYSRPQLSATYEEPETPIEMDLARVWRDLLGVEQIGRHDDFFELGGQSLVAMRLFAWIRKEYRINMPLATLFEAPTIAQSAAVIAAQLGVVEAHVSGLSSGADPTVNRTVDTDAAATMLAEAMSVGSGTAIMPLPIAARSLVPIASAGKGRPLFIVHGAGGNVLFLWSLARALAGDRPIFGFQAMGVNSSDTPDQTVEEMASRYVGELVGEHEGPYLLGGYSGGGVVTMEMVRQLQVLGHDVEHVILFDSVPADRPLPGSRQRLVNILTNARIGGPRAVTPRYSTEKITRYLARVLPAGDDDPDHRDATDFALGYEEMDGYVDLYDHFSAVAARYRTKVYDVDVTVFKADQIAPIQPWDYYWREHVRGSLTLRFVRGDHHTMFYPEFIPHLAAQVRQRLAEVEDGLDVTTPGTPDPIRR